MALASTRRLERGLCVRTSPGKNGEPQLVINTPDIENQALKHFMDSLASSKSSPVDLAKEFHRCCSLLKITMYLTVALREQPDVIESVYEVAEDFQSLYQCFCDSLYDLLFSSYEAFQLFKTSCQYYNGGFETLGEQYLNEMGAKSEAAMKKLDKIIGQVDKLTEKINALNLKLRQKSADRNNIDSKAGNEQADIFGRCFAECASCVVSIRVFLNDQESFLAAVQCGFDLRTHCKRIRDCLSVNSFRRLITDMSPEGFMEEIHNTIIRCVAASTLSADYAKKLRSKKEPFNDMVSTVVTADMAQEGVFELISKYNEDFPGTPMPKPRVDNIKRAHLAWCPPPPYHPPEAVRQAPQQDDSWGCVIL